MNGRDARNVGLSPVEARQLVLALKLLIQVVHLRLEGLHQVLAEPAEAALEDQPGVGAACLSLQDRRNVDVNVLLMVAYAWAVLGRDPGAAEIADLTARVALAK